MLAERVILIVLDSFGVGALPDAKKYGDEKANTLLHIDQVVGGLKVPNLEKLGLGKIIDAPGLKSDLIASGAYGKLKEKSQGKDTTTGHWEIAGLISEEAFPTYPQGFPDEVIDKFEKMIGRKVLGNKPASGTAILDEYGREHMETGRPIVYTSADSVFQIAAHEEIVPLKKLYIFCNIARAILKGPHAVGRVIARPFIGKPGDFTRTANRHDYSLPPVGETVLDVLQAADLPVIGVGKIKDIFAGKGISDCVYTIDNMDGVDKTLYMMQKYRKGLIFTNLVDFDMKYGHRNDVQGYAKALEEFDQRIPEIMRHLTRKDVLIITADHGCDPTTEGTDHTREYTPVLIYGEMAGEDINLGTRETFADIGATVAELLGCHYSGSGVSMVKEILSIKNEVRYFG
jgi:phosphopentomutase